MTTLRLPRRILMVLVCLFAAVAIVRSQVGIGGGIGAGSALIDNIDFASAGTAVITATSGTSLGYGMTFATGATSLTLNGAQLMVSHQQYDSSNTAVPGSFAGGTGFQLQLFQVSYANGPTLAAANLLETLSGSAGPTADGYASYTSAGTILTANTSYMLLATAVNPAPGDPAPTFFPFITNAAWFHTAWGYTPGYGVAYTNNGAPSYALLPQGFFNVTVSGAPAVPEPAAASVFAGAGVLGLALFRRRRMARQPAG